jgi:hypothetical protein
MPAQMARTTAAGTCLAVLGLLLVHAQGHGLMVRPQSRNFQVGARGRPPSAQVSPPHLLLLAPAHPASPLGVQYYLKAKTYSFADEASAGGAKSVSNSRTMRWPAGRHGVCGDPASGSLKYNKPIGGFAPSRRLSQAGRRAANGGARTNQLLRAL